MPRAATSNQIGPSIADLRAQESTTNSPSYSVRGACANGISAPFLRRPFGP